MLELVPKHLLESMMMTALEQTAYALQYIPDTLKTLEMCIDAVTRKGRMLEAVPAKFVNDEMYWLALRSDVWSLESIPKPDQTTRCASSPTIRKGTSFSL
jgi:hypothetical protein